MPSARFRKEQIPLDRCKTTVKVFFLPFVVGPEYVAGVELRIEIRLSVGLVEEGGASHDGFGTQYLRPEFKAGFW
jgi:hypothetical protein